MVLQYIRRLKVLFQYQRYYQLAYVKRATIKVLFFPEIKTPILLTSYVHNFQNYFSYKLKSFIHIFKHFTLVHT